MGKLGLVVVVALLAVCTDASARQAAAPPIPDALMQQVQNQPSTDCTGDNPQMRIRPGQTFYPSMAIEREQQGWGIVRFDVLPDGKVGAVTVVADAPAGFGFGNAAAQMVKLRRYPPHPNGCAGILFFTTFSTR